MPAVRAIIRDAAKNDNRMSSFILGVVNSARVPDGEADDDASTDRRTPARPKRSSSTFTVEESECSSRTSTFPAARS